MNQSWLIDPATGDYVMDSNGKPTIDTGLKTPAYFRLKTPRTKWMYAPDTSYGSDFYSVKQHHSVNDFRVLEGIGKKALQPLVDDGRAKSVDIVTTFDSRNASKFRTTITDAAGQIEEQNFDPIGR